MPAIYKPPVQDIEFALFDVGQALQRTAGIPEYAEIDRETVMNVIQAAAQFTVEEVLPLNAKGDQEGCILNPDKSVTTPKGFKEAYQKFCAQGLMGISADKAHGGSGFPSYTSTAVYDFMLGANVSWTMAAILTAASINILQEYGDEELKRTRLPMLIDGRATGTMCLTQTQAGSDVGANNAAALPRGCEYDITSDNIFITYGEHDFTDNIFHQILARLPDGAKGTKGLNLFSVPKKLLDTGQSNHVTCTHLEEKMGLHASPTGQMNFNNAKGRLIGEPHKGMEPMLKMMNDARLKIAQQGLSLGDVALQSAAQQAKIRVQGRLISDVINGNGVAPPVAIIEHHNILRDLVEMSALKEGYRLLTYNIAVGLTVAKKHPDAAIRTDAEDYASLMTPVAKTCMTDFGCSAAQKGIQIHGGMGFMKETGVEQFYRDAIIATIYEGTNDIQGIDFTFRKATRKTGRLEKFTDSLSKDIKKSLQNERIASSAGKMQEALQMFQETTAQITGKAEAEKYDEVLVNSYDYISMFGRLAVGGMWLKALDTVTTRTQPLEYPTDFFKTKEMLGHYYIDTMMLPDMKRHEMRITGDNAKGIAAFKPEQF